ncbi:MAG: hypothetical protein ACXAD7_03635 [Candidatus Kariarchaeaceae archaeon]|jgi:hypothetical protein
MFLPYGETKEDTLVLTDIKKMRKFLKFISNGVKLKGKQIEDNYERSYRKILSILLTPIDGKLRWWTPQSLAEVFNKPIDTIRNVLNTLHDLDIIHLQRRPAVPGYIYEYTSEAETFSWRDFAEDGSLHNVESKRLSARRMVVAIKHSSIELALVPDKTQDMHFYAKATLDKMEDYVQSLKHLSFKGVLEFIRRGSSYEAFDDTQNILMCRRAMRFLDDQSGKDATMVILENEREDIIERLLTIGTGTNRKKSPPDMPRAENLKPIVEHTLLRMTTNERRGLLSRIPIEATSTKGLSYIYRIHAKSLILELLPEDSFADLLPKVDIYYPSNDTLLKNGIVITTGIFENVIKKAN